MSIHKYYGEHFLRFELIISVLLAGIIILFFEVISPIEKVALIDWVNNNHQTVFPLLATISATLLGFIITGISVIIAFFQTDSKKMKKIEERPEVMRQIFDTYFSSIVYLALTVILCVIILTVNDGLRIVLTYAIIWAVIISSFRIWRSVWALKNIVEIIISRKPKLSKQVIDLPRR